MLKNVSAKALLGIRMIENDWRQKRRRFLAAMAISFTAAFSANADTQLHIDYDQAYQGYVSMAGFFGPQDVPLTALRATYVSGDKLPSPTGNTFNTFCVDISEQLHPDGSWQATAFPTTSQNGDPIPYVAGGIQRAAGIYDAYANNADITSASGQLWGAALQVAIWSDLYGNAFSLSSDGHDLTAVEALVNQILTSAANAGNSHLTSTFWNATESSINQDLIGPPLENGFVPEPGTYAAAVCACAYLCFLHFQNRHSRTKRTRAFFRQHN